MDHKPTNVRWLVFALACGASFLLYLHRYSWNLVGPIMQKDLGLTELQAGFLFSLFYYTYAAGQIPSGVLIDRFGPHRFLGVIVVAWSISLAALGQTAILIRLQFLRLLFGAAQAGCYPALTKVTRQWFPLHQRTTLQGWIATTSGRAGGAMSPIILGTVLMGALGMSWQWAALLLGLVGVAYSAIFLLLFRNVPDNDPRVNAAELALIHEGAVPATAMPAHAPTVLPARVALANRSLRFFTVQQFLDAGSDVAFVSLIGKFFLEAHHFELTKTGWLASLPLWGGALGGMLGGFLNDRLIRVTGNRRWSRSGVGCVGKVAGCTMLILMTQQSNGVAAGFLLMAAKFFGDWSQPTTWGMCTDLGGRFSATVFSIINTAGTIGGIVMPLVFATTLQYFKTEAGTNWTPLFLLLSAMYLGSGICWLLVDCTKRLEA